MLRALWVVLLTSVAWSIPFEQVPNPRRNHSWVSDVAHVLNASEVHSFDQDISTLERQNGTEIAVVILPDCGGREPREYAHRLLNYWGVGKPRIDNGVLFLVAMKEHRTEIATGDGARRYVSDANLKQMLESQVVPHFKASHPNLGVGVGLRWLCRELTPAAYAKLTPLSTEAQRIGDPRRQGSLVADPDKLLSPKLRPTVQARLESLISGRDLQIVTIMLKKKPKTPLPQFAGEIQRAWKTVGRDGLFLVSLKPPTVICCWRPRCWPSMTRGSGSGFCASRRRPWPKVTPNRRWS